MSDQASDDESTTEGSASEQPAEVEAVPSTMATAETAVETATATTPAVPGATASETATESNDTRPNRRKAREGVVVSAKMQETVVVSVVDKVRHPRYGKTMQRTKRLYAHSVGNDAREGDRVRVQETRPMSKLKRWRVVEVLERAR
jgi:small subunit ribosomal protein S17